MAKLNVGIIVILVGFLFAVLYGPEVIGAGGGGGVMMMIFAGLVITAGAVLVHFFPNWNAIG